VTDSERLAALRRYLLPSGTKLADAAPDRRGLTLAAWWELQFLEMKAARPAVTAAATSLPRISTSRDNYGWRSLPSGSRYLGPK